MTQEERDTILLRIANKVDKLEDRFTNFEIEMLDFKEEMTEFKGEMLDFKEEMTEFKGEMLDFKEEMTEFKGEMLDFKEEMTEFKGEMLDFKEEMTEFKGEMLDFKEKAIEDERGTDRMLTIICKRQEIMQEDIKDLKQIAEQTQKQLNILHDLYKIHSEKIQNHENRIQQNEIMTERLTTGYFV